MKRSLKSIFFGEGTVPQGSANERPLHDAPIYYYPTGRSFPKNLQDRGGVSTARKWNKGGALLHVDHLVNKKKKKKRWYVEENVNYKSPYKMSKEEFVNYENPKPDPGYRLLYHETENRNLFAIAKEGIKISKSRYRETGDIGNTIWASTNPEGWYGNHPLVIFQVPENEKEPTIEYAGSTVMIHRDIKPKDIIDIDPVFHTDLGVGRLSFFRKSDYAETYWDEHFGVKNESMAMVQEGFKLSLDIFRQDSAGSTSASEKLSRKIGSGRTRTRKENRKAGLREFNALSTAAIEAYNIPPGSWDRDDEPRVDQEKIKANKAYVKKLGVTSVEAANGTEVHVDHMDPQYKRQISMLKSPENVIEWKEPNYLEECGEHRIGQLGYAKIADRQSDLKMDVYLASCDPNWKRSEDTMQQVIKHWVDNHGNPKRIMPEPDATMMVSIKEAWEDLRDTFKEYYPHDPAVNYHKTEPGVEGEFYSMTEDYYHGTNKEFAPGDYIMPPSETGEISEKGRKKNLDKVFFTLDKSSAKIYAGRAVQSFGSGSPNVYKVQPIGSIEWLNKQKGTTVLMAPMAKVIEKVSSQ